MHLLTARLVAIVYPLKLLSQWAQEQWSAARCAWDRAFPEIPLDKDDPDDTEGRQW